MLAACLAAAPAQARTRGPGPVRGITLGLYYPEDRAQALTSIDRIAALGATHVALPIPLEQRDRRSTGLQSDAAMTPSDSLLLAVSLRARARGLEVVFFPLVHLRHAAPGEWRGILMPTSWETWFESYRGWMTHYARLAGRAGASWLCVGAELNSSESHAGEWGRLIDSVRAVYPGRLLYSQNWDHLRRLPFAPRLDLVGCNAYFELSRDPEPSPAQLSRAWAGIRRHLTTRPVLFTEVGYPSSERAAMRPWDYVTPHHRRPDLQARCFEAFFEAWDRVPGFAGCFVYLWSVREGGAEAGYSVRGKPAERTVARWYRRGFPAGWMGSRTGVEPGRPRLPSRPGSGGAQKGRRQAERDTAPAMSLPKTATGPDS